MRPLLLQLSAALALTQDWSFYRWQPMVRDSRTRLLAINNVSGRQTGSFRFFLTFNAIFSKKFAKGRGAHNH